MHIIFGNLHEYIHIYSNKILLSHVDDKIIETNCILRLHVVTNMAAIRHRMVIGINLQRLSLKLTAFVFFWKTFANDVSVSIKYWWMRPVMKYLSISVTVPDMVLNAVICYLRFRLTQLLFSVCHRLLINVADRRLHLVVSR